MSDNTGIDIFDELAATDFSEVETTRPVLAAGLYEFSITNMERTIWKSGQGSSLVIQLALQSEGVDQSGERHISAGYVVTDRISLVKKGEYEPAKQVAKFLESIGMKDQPFDPSFESYRGAGLLARTKVVGESTSDDGVLYPAKPEIASYVKAS